MKPRTLSELRKSFDEIDQKLVVLLHARAQLSMEIAEVKRKKKLSVLQQEVWEKQIRKRLKENKKLTNRPAYIESIFALIHKESLRIQQQELKKIK